MDVVIQLIEIRPAHHSDEAPRQSILNALESCDKALWVDSRSLAEASPVSTLDCGGQGRDRTADASLFSS